MFYFFSKGAQWFLWPLSQYLLLAGGALLALALKRERLAKILVLLGLLVLFFPSLPILANALIAKLEQSFPPLSFEQAPEADAIVVLGGTTRGLRASRPFIEEPFGSRLVPAARLYRAKKAAHIIVTEGLPYSLADGTTRTGAQDMKAFLVELGVPAAAVLLETAARNTNESARFVAEIIRQYGFHRLLLITSASHMRRAVQAFRKAGVKGLTAFPTDFRSETKVSWGSWVPSATALFMSTTAVKEYVGYWVYTF